MFYPANPNCKYCKGRGKIELLVTIVDCDCIKSPEVYIMPEVLKDIEDFFEDHSFVPKEHFDDVIINVTSEGDSI